MRCDLLSQALSLFLRKFRWKSQIVETNEKIVSFVYPHLYSKLLDHLAHEFLAWIFKKSTEPICFTPRLQNLLPQMRQGGLMLTAHFGNWELLGTSLIAQGVPLVASYEPLRPAFLNTILVKLRSAPQSYGIVLRGHPFALRQLIRQGKLFTFLADQDFRDPTRSIHSQFLGQPVSCNPLPIFLQKQFPNLQVFFCWTLRQPDGTLQVDGIILGSDIYSDYNAQLSQLVFTNPEQWAGWTHRRFLSSNSRQYIQDTIS